MSKPIEGGADAREALGLFVYRRRPRFGETDAAGIVYTGEFPKIGLEAIEAWFHERLNLSWYGINADEGYGTPFVHLSLDFRSPATPREELHIPVILDRAGRSSLTFRVEGWSGSRLCFEGRFVCAFMANATKRAMPIPERYREAVVREAELGRVVSGAETEEPVS